MNSSPSGGEDLHIVQPDKPLPRIREPGSPDESRTEIPADSSPGPLEPGGSGRFTFVASLLLIALAFSIGLSYFFEKRWGGRFTTIQPKGAGETALVESGTAGALGPESFRVSSISLGDKPWAMVNGTKVSEGDSLVVGTASAPVTARVAKIDEGVVRFLADGETIEAKVNPTAGSTTVP